MERRCPDCAVHMEKITVRAGGHDLEAYTDDAKRGLLGKLGVERPSPLAVVACPECGLVRTYVQE